MRSSRPPDRRAPSGSARRRPSSSARSTRLRATIARRGGRPGPHLSVRRRARLPPLRPAVRAGGRRDGIGPAPDLRARRRDASASAQSAGHRSRPESTAYLARARRPGDDGFDFTGDRAGSAATATSAPPSRRAPSATSAGSPPSRAHQELSRLRRERGRRESAAVDAKRGAHPARRRSGLRLAADPMGASRSPASELSYGRERVERSGGRGTEIVTGDEFSDSAIKAPRRSRASTGSSISPPTAWSPRRGPNARPGRP